MRSSHSILRRTIRAIQKRSLHVIGYAARTGTLLELVKRARNLTTKTMADELAEHFEEQASVRPPKGKGRSAGGGKGRSGGPGQGRDVEISRALSRLLRHQAENAGIKLDQEGFAPLDRVLKWGPLRTLEVSVAEVRKAVTESDKQRFSMKPNPKTNPELDESSDDPADWLIRANQGHSIKLESEAMLRPVTLELNNIPPTVVHGTYFAFWPKILDSGGLKRMGRNHVHCSTGLPEDKESVISGMRKDAELLIYIDVRRSLEDKAMTWWISDNGVLLSEGDENDVVSTKYFKEVVGRKEEVGVLWKDGEKVADLPDHVKGRTPPSKGGVGGRGGRTGRGGRGRGGRQ